MSEALSFGIGVVIGLAILLVIQIIMYIRS